MFSTIITDCKSENAKARQETRFNCLGLGPVSFVGIDSNFGNIPTLEAGGNLIDILDASEGKPGVISVNVAPRGNKKEGENGNSFCYFYHKKTLIISTIAGHTLSFIKKFNLTDKVKILDTRQVLEWAVSENFITNEQKKYISSSQFRSFDFVPHVAKWLVEGKKVPSQPYLLNNSYQLPNSIWSIDAFGNCKTTLTNDDLLPLKDCPLKVQKLMSNNSHPEFISGSQILSQVQNDKYDNRLLRQTTHIKESIVKTNLGNFPFYQRLKDVPKGETAIYVGSSGLSKKRFLEIATQAVPGSAAKTLNFSVGNSINLI